MFRIKIDNRITSLAPGLNVERLVLLRCAPIVVAVSFAIILGVWHRGAEPAGQRSGLRALHASDTVPAAKLVSIGSCSASGCHGARIEVGNDEEQPAWKTSYTVWASLDPHAGAYATLLSDRSRRIVEKLYAWDAANHWSYSQRLQKSCTMCHSTVQEEDALNDLSFADGVNCQSCHGAAGKMADGTEGWGYTHTLESWLKPATEKTGFQDQNQITTRAATCAQCHVGSVDREVNHDLIAAGHPRLNFEFAAYMDRLSDTKHWREESDFPSHQWWAVGQLVSARSAIELLLHSANGSSAAKNLHIWPEFAGFRCDSCHLPITGSAASSSLKDSTVGKWKWGSWYFANGNILDHETSGLIKIIKDQMSLPAPNRSEVAQRCDQLTERLNHLISRWASGSRDTAVESLDMLQLAVDRDLNNEPLSSLDEIEQWYLAVRALAASNQQADISDQTKSLLDEFRMMLVRQDVGFGSSKRIEFYNYKAKTILENIAPWLSPGTDK